MTAHSLTVVTEAISPEVFKMYTQMCSTPDIRSILQQRQNASTKTVFSHSAVRSPGNGRSCEELLTILCQEAVLLVLNNLPCHTKQAVLLLHVTWTIPVTVTGWEIPVSQNTSVSYLQLLCSLFWANGSAGEAGGKTKSQPAKIILGPYHILRHRKQVDLGLQLLEEVSRQLSCL